MSHDWFGYTLTRASDGGPVWQFLRPTEREVIELMESQLPGSYASAYLCGQRVVRVTVTMPAAMKEPARD